MGEYFRALLLSHLHVFAPPHIRAGKTLASGGEFDHFLTFFAFLVSSVSWNPPIFSFSNRIHQIS
jgi:hypothetical protein